MSSRASAARYARALFDVALKESEPGQIEQELSSITSLIKQHADLQTALESPSVSPTGKKAVVEALVQRGQFTSSVGKLLVMLAERDRLVLLPEVLEAFQARLREQRKVIEAEVTTAIPLEPAQQAVLQQRLSAATAREVTVTMKVDPELIGGVVARIGTTVYDGSLATQLARLRGRLAENR
jgi:F-type H+-transporting ATPase subunit delta